MQPQLARLLENSRNYTTAVAEAMPEKYYAVKAVDGAWNFGELIDHIAYGMYWWKDNCILGIKADWNPPAAAENKAEILQRLKEAYDSLEAGMSGAAATDQATEGFHATLDHITHHRGQAVLFLRLQGIEPPEYRY